MVDETAAGTQARREPLGAPSVFRFLRFVEAFPGAASIDTPASCLLGWAHVRTAPPPRAHPMRLYQGRITPIASAIVKALVSNDEIETEAPKDVEADIEAVLKTYLDAERQVNDEAKDLMQARKLAPHELGRIKRLVADKKGIAIGDDTLDYLLDQIVAMLMYSNAVSEVFVEDVDLRRRMAPILKREMAVDEQLEQETRARLRHVQEGTRTWEVEYQRVIEDIRRRKGL